MMAKMMGPRFKQSRRLGLNVCGHPKAMDRATQENSRESRNLTEYGKQLLEKQRLRAYYGVMEGQFLDYVKEAAKEEDPTGTALVKSLETRLDNLTYRMGFASSIRQARQMVVHGHILLNGKKINIPSYAVNPGDTLTLKEKSRNTELFKDNFEGNFITSYPYMEKDEDNFSVTLTRMPEREEIPIEIQDQLIVEFYSKLI